MSTDTSQSSASADKPKCGGDKIDVKSLTSDFKKATISGNSINKNDLLYFGVEKITETDLKEQRQKRVVVNGETIALFHYENSVYAIQDKCPHYGGPLHQGDIEELPDVGACIRCPWHSWKFSLKNGACVSPQRDDKFLKIFPVKVVKETKEIKIGFEKIAESIFNTPP